MTDLQWIKLHVDLFDNPKIRYLDTLPKGDTYFRIWINLMVLAGKINNQGLVYFHPDRPHNMKTLATVLLKPEKVVAEAIQLFEEMHMIQMKDGYIMILNWEKYQNQARLEVIRENNREAKRRQRDRQAALVSDMSLKCHPCHATELELDLELEKDKEIQRKDKEKDKAKTKKLAEHSRAKSSSMEDSHENHRGDEDEIDRELTRSNSLN